MTSNSPRSLVLALVALVLLATASGVVVGTASSTHTDGIETVTEHWNPSAAGASNGTNVSLVVRLSDVKPAQSASTTEAQATLVSHAASTQPSVREYAEQHDGVTIVNSLWLTNAVLVEVTDPSDPNVVADDIAALPDVVAVHPNYVYTVELETPRPTGQLVGVQAASNVSVTPGLATIDASETWETYHTRGDGVRVAVLDTGVDATHPDIRLQTANASDPTYPGGWAEFNSIGLEIDGSTPVDPNGHGTHVSGTLAGGNESGTAIGVAPNATLLVGKVLNDDGSGTFFQIIAGMQWAVDADVDVISMSIGAPGYHPEFVRPVRNAESAGVVVVAASGNYGPNQSVSPGNVYEVVSVGAVDDRGTVASFSGSEEINTTASWGDAAPSTWPETYTVPRVSAPGVDVQSSLPNGEYGSTSGTSMATPHVAGTVALMLSAAKRPLAPEEVRRILAETADTATAEATDATGSAESNETRGGAGVVNAKAATARAVGESDANEPNDAPEAATAVGGTPEQGIVTSATDTDWFRIDTNGTTLDVHFERMGGTGTLEATLVRAETTEWSLESPTVEVDPDESVDGTVTVPEGTHFVSIQSGEDGGTGSYELSVQPAESVGDAGEPNDAANTATPLVPGTAVEAAIEPTLDVDFYRVDVTANESIVVEMAFSNERGDLDLGLYDADGVLLTQSLSTDDSERIEYVSDTDQSLYVSVVGFNGATGPYTLEASVAGISRSASASATASAEKE